MLSMAAEQIIRGFVTHANGNAQALYEAIDSFWTMLRTDQKSEFSGATSADITCAIFEQIAGHPDSDQIINDIIVAALQNNNASVTKELAEYFESPNIFVTDADGNQKSLLIIALERQRFAVGGALFACCHFEIERERIWNTDKLAQLLLGMEEAQVLMLTRFINNTLSTEESFEDPASSLANNLLDGFLALTAPGLQKVLIVSTDDTDESVHYSVQIRNNALTVSRVAPELHRVPPAVRIVPQERATVNGTSDNSLTHPFSHRLSSI